jgi:eukaryotic-like serine/threonine-protein kinase
VSAFSGRSGQSWSFDEADRIGERGGFGEVFRGRDQDGNPVAIKRVRLRVGDAAERRRRAREVEVADLLLVLPLAADGSLRAALDCGALDHGQQLDAITDVVRGLVELAEFGILHRDLKPQNVLRLVGRWRIADFGIARGTRRFRRRVRARGRVIQWPIYSISTDKMT